MRLLPAVINIFWASAVTDVYKRQDDLFGEVIAEKFIPFDYEVSIVGARFKNGEKRFYPVTHNLQQNGILRYSVTDVSFPQQHSQQIQAESMLCLLYTSCNLNELSLG